MPRDGETHRIHEDQLGDSGIVEEPELGRDPTSYGVADGRHTV
jgi:hypothetical protein